MDRGYKPYGIIFFFVTIFLLTSMGMAKAETFCVSTAQELHDALTEAQSNGQDDIIRIVQGTYNGNFIYASTEAYGVTVEGGYTADCASRVVNPENTALDAGGSGPVLAFSAPEVAAGFRVDGFTMQNGNVVGNHGAGLFINTAGGDVTVLETVVVSNTALSNGSMSIYGGGIYIRSAANVILENNVITQNSSWGSSWCYGGGVGIGYVGTASLINNLIQNNRTMLGGGGAFVHAATTVIFEQNMVLNNYVDANWQGGGGVHLNSNQSSTVANNLFSDNQTWGYGGAIYFYSLQTTFFVNNTIINNQARDGCGVWYSDNWDVGAAQIFNNLFWNNTDYGAALGRDLFINNDNDGNYFPSVVNIFNNDFNQGTNGIYIQIPFTIDPSNLNNVNPLFVDAANGDYHLQSGSPVINQGSNSAPGLPSTDKDGLPRILYGIVDMGAYEYLCTGSYSLTATKEGTGSGSLSASGLSCNGNTCSGTYNCGTTITITATADTGSHFEAWSGCDSTSNNLCVVSMAGSKSVSATFTLDTYTLTATKAGTGSGSLTAPGLSCVGNTCTGTYNYNETVHITATADTGSVFAFWSGCHSVNNNVCTILINGDKSVTATFYLEYTLLVHLEGTGDGRVVSTPSGIDCEPTCSDTFPVNTPVTLRAYPYGGSAFAYWSGACAGAFATCEVTMTSYIEVTAHFVSDETKEYKLSVGKKRINKGDGLIQSDDGTISCGTVCTGLYYPNAPITLRATPSPGTLFEGWTPDSLNCGTSPTCSFTMDTKHKVKAIFRGPYRLLTKIKSKNNGSGSVTADISGIGTGINCPSSSCEDYYPYGNNVVLTAQPGGSSLFTGWKPASLGCGINSTCTVPMIKKQTVTATFEGI